MFRKVFASVICDRMKGVFTRLEVLDPTNPGFQAGRTTANSIFPLRAAAEHCHVTETEFSTLLGDVKWCFDTPASTVIELALMRLGVPEFYVNLLNGRSHCTLGDHGSHGATVAITGLIHRQLHGTGQGTGEGPINWIPIADIVIAIARQRSTQPVSLPTGAGRSLPFGRAWFVDDAGLAQAGAGSTPALQRVVDGTGLMHCFLGQERRGSKCLWSKLRWTGGKLARKPSGEGEQLVARSWLACWHERGVHMIEQTPTVIKEFDYDEKFKHLGYSASPIGRSTKSEVELLAIARRVTSVFRRKSSLARAGRAS